MFYCQSSPKAVLLTWCTLFICKHGDNQSARKHDVFHFSTSVSLFKKSLTSNGSKLRAEFNANE